MAKEQFQRTKPPGGGEGQALGLGRRGVRVVGARQRGEGQHRQASQHALAQRIRRNDAFLSRPNPENRRVVPNPHRHRRRRHARMPRQRLDALYQPELPNVAKRPHADTLLPRMPRARLEGALAPLPLPPSRPRAHYHQRRPAHATARPRAGRAPGGRAAAEGPDSQHKRRVPRRKDPRQRARKRAQTTRRIEVRVETLVNRKGGPVEDCEVIQVESASASLSFASWSTLGEAGPSDTGPGDPEAGDPRSGPGPET